MGDKGFTIEDLLSPSNCSLNIPPFLSETVQFTKENVEMTQRIAKLRVRTQREPVSHARHANHKLACVAGVQRGERGEVECEHEARLLGARREPHEHPMIALRALIQLPLSLPFVRRPRRLAISASHARHANHGKKKTHVDDVNIK